jgi:hypothetical protein
MGDPIDDVVSIGVIRSWEDGTYDSGCGIAAVETGISQRFDKRTNNAKEGTHCRHWLEELHRPLKERSHQNQSTCDP